MKKRRRFVKISRSSQTQDLLRRMVVLPVLAVAAPTRNERPARSTSGSTLDRVRGRVSVTHWLRYHQDQDQEKTSRWWRALLCESVRIKTIKTMTVHTHPSQSSPEWITSSWSGSDGRWTRTSVFYCKDCSMDILHGLYNLSKVSVQADRDLDSDLDCERLRELSEVTRPEPFHPEPSRA